MEMAMGILNWLMGMSVWLLTGCGVVGIIIIVVLAVPLIALVCKVIEKGGVVFIKCILYLIGCVVFVLCVVCVVLPFIAIWLGWV